MIFPNKGTFVIPSGASANVTLNVTTNDALSTVACTKSEVASSGSLSCIVPNNFGNGTVVASFYKNGVLVGQGQVNLAQTPQQIFGGGLVFVAILSMLIIIGVSISDNPITMIFSIVIGFILLMVFNVIGHTGFIGAGATFLFLIIAVVIALIKGVKRN